MEHMLRATVDRDLWEGSQVPITIDRRYMMMVCIYRSLTK